MTKKPDLLSAAERSVKALLLKSKDASLDEQVDTIRAVTAFLMVKHRIAPDKEDDDWLSDAQRRLRGNADAAADVNSSPKPNGTKAQRRAGRDAYLAASRAAEAASNGTGSGERGHLSFTADGVTTDITELANVSDDSDEDDEADS